MKKKKIKIVIIYVFIDSSPISGGFVIQKSTEEWGHFVFSDKIQDLVSEIRKLKGGNIAIVKTEFPKRDDFFVESHFLLLGDFAKKQLKISLEKELNIKLG